MENSTETLLIILITLLSIVTITLLAALTILAITARRVILKVEKNIDAASESMEKMKTRVTSAFGMFRFVRIFARRRKS